MTTYNKDQEYTLKVVNTDNEVKEIKYIPEKDMSKPEMIMALKAKYKNFFKLIESKIIETKNLEVDWFEHRDYNDFRSDIIQGELKDGRQFLSGDINDIHIFKKGYNAIKKLDTKLETDDENVLEQIDIDMANNEDDITNEEADTINNQIFNRKIESKLIESENTDIISKLNNLKDEFMSNLYKDKDKANEVKNQIKQVLQDAPDGTEMCRVVQDTSSHRDIVNIGTDKWGNPIGKSTNRVDYPNKKEESYGETKYEVSSYYGKDFKGLEDSLNTNNYDEVETFIWKKLQNGNTVECIDTETGDRKRYSPETHEYGDETFGIEDYRVESKYDYKKVNKAMSGVEKILKQNGYNLTHDDINLETDNNGEIHVYDKLTGDEVLVVTQDMLRNILTEATLDNSVIVLSYGRGTRFPNRQTAINYYKECIEGTDPNEAENYAYHNILNMLVSTEEPVVYDWDDKTEYDWWVQKGKPIDDISDIR